MNFPEELLSENQKKKLNNQTIRSIKSSSKTSGDTQIIIETNDFLIKLGANDLGAWLEKIVKKKLNPVIEGKS